MAFKSQFLLPEQTAVLEIQDGAYAGAEIEVRLTMPLGDFLKVQEMVEAKDIIQACTAFAESVLVGWNIEDKAGPVPADAGGMKRIPPQFAILLLEKWAEAVAKPSAPLAEQSADLSTLAAASRALPANGLRSLGN